MQASTGGQDVPDALLAFALAQVLRERISSRAYMLGSAATIAYQARSACMRQDMAADGLLSVFHELLHATASCRRVDEVWEQLHTTALAPGSAQTASGR